MLPARYRSSPLAESNGRPALIEKQIQILETTLRDGSYAIDFQFSAGDTTVICRELEQAGFDLIEVGHGIGLGASEAGLGQAAESDDAYCKAASSALKQSRFGMFCIPGIARLSHVDMAADHGMGFIRIGTNVTEVESSRPFVERARHHGMFVYANFMKSYAVDPQSVGQRARESQEYGAQTIYIVDSAGGMLPDELTTYYEAVRSACSLPVAFHCHNNLGLAVSNSLHMANLGCSTIDSSLQGLGRSSGNAQTELLAAAMMRSGYQLRMDLIRVLDIGEKYVRRLLTTQGLSSLLYRQLNAARACCSEGKEEKRTKSSRHPMVRD